MQYRAESRYETGPARPRSVTRRRCLTVATVVVLTGLAVTAQATDLFTPVEAAPPALPAAELILRSRMVSMDLGQVQRARAAVAPPAGPAIQTRALAVQTAKPALGPPPGTTLTLNLFADTVVTARVERTTPTFSGGYSIAGHLVDEPLGTLTLVVNGETVVGTVRLVEETYHIRSVGDGLYAISEVEEPPLDCGVDALHFEPNHQH